MAQTNSFQDRYGLTLTTSSVTAVECYVKGIDQFLSADVGADTALAHAIEADEEFAAAYASLALIQQFQGTAAEAKQSAARARACIGRPIEAGATICRGDRHVCRWWRVPCAAAGA